MPGTRTAPALTGAETFLELSIRYIDAVGDVRSDTSLVDATATDAELEAVVAGMVTASNASIWSAKVSRTWEGAKSKSNAVAAVRESVQDNIVYHAKSVGRVDRRAFIPSPVEALFIADTETPDPDNGTVANVMATWLAAWKDTFASLSLRFTERREINEKINL